MTTLCLKMVDAVLRALIDSVERVPFALRATLRLIVLRVQKWRQETEENKEISSFSASDLPDIQGLKKTLRLHPDDILLLSEYLVACWLNTGFRDPSCFGVPHIIPE